MKIMKSDGISFDDLKSPRNVDNIAYRKCAMAMAMPQDRKSGLPCRVSYNESISYMIRSDQLTGEACDLIKSAGQVSCSKGQADCLKKVKDKFAEARKKLQESSDASQESMKSLTLLSRQSKILAQSVSMHLHQIAVKLAALPPDTPPLSKMDPAVDQALESQKVEGLPLPIMMSRMNIQNLNAKEFENKAQELNTAVASSNPDTSSLDPFSQQLASSITSRDVAAFTSYNQRYAAETNQTIDKQVAAFDKVVSGLDTPQSTTGNKPAASPAAAATNIAPTAAAAAAPVNSSSASRAPAGGSLPSGSTSAPDMPSFPSSLAPMQGSSYSPLRAASRKSASVARPPETSSFTPSANSPAKDSPVAEKSAKAANSPAAKTPTGEFEEVTRAAILSASVFGASDNHAKQGASGLTIAPAQSPGESSAISVSEPGASPVSPASSGVAAQAEKFASVEISKMEANSGPMSSGLREMLRRRLTSSFTERMKEAQEASAAAKAASSAGAVASLLDSEAGSGAVSGEQFRMASSDTDAEVRRLMGQAADQEQLSQEDLRSLNVSLFERVHAAHRRVFR